MKIPEPECVRESDESGQTMVEYTVVLSMITVAIVLTIASLSGAVDGLMQDVVALL